MSDRSADEQNAIKRDAAVLWEAIHQALRAGLAVPQIELNRLHWRAALQEIEILRDELAEFRRPKSPPSSNQRAGLALRLQEWSRNCLIDGLKMDNGKPTLQALLREAVPLLLAAPSAVETSVTESGQCARSPDGRHHFARYPCAYCGIPWVPVT